MSMKEETDFVLLWKEHYEKIDQALVINKKLLRETIGQKARSALQSLIRLKTTGIIVLIVYLVLLGVVLSFALLHYSSAANYLIISMAAIFIINVKALYDYIKHLVWINHIDYDGSITEIQKKLIRLQLSIFRHTRIMVLQFPFWTTFYLSDKWFPQHTPLGFVIFQFAITASFTYLAYWLYKNQQLTNADKRWFKTLMSGSGGKEVMKALSFYKEIENYSSCPGDKR